MRYPASILPAALSFVLLVAQAQAAPGESMSSVGDWKVFTSKENCYISSEWKNKGVKYGLAFGYTQKGKIFILTFADSSAKIKGDAKVKSEINIDKTFTTKADGTAREDTFMFAFDGDSPIIQQIMNGNEIYIDLTVANEDSSYNFTLEDTKKALETLDVCRATAD